MACQLRHGSICGIYLLCVASLGCLQVPVCVPEMSMVPAVTPCCTKAEVHAFRVDVTDRQQIKEGLTPSSIRPENFEDFALSRVALSSSGTTPQQVGMTWASGWCTVGFWNYFNSLTTHSVAIRLYRPGFETIELKPGDAAHALQWVEATDLAAQEKAVDDLLGVSPLAMGAAPSEFQQRRVEPGTKSPAHREALQFAAREYERLARSAAPEDVQAEEIAPRLFAKARSLKRLAEGKQPSAIEKLFQEPQAKACGYRNRSNSCSRRF